MPDNLDDQIKNEQLLKLKLENEALKKSTKWKIFLQLSPFITALIAGIGFYIGIYQFTEQQKESEKNRIMELDERKQTRELEFRKRFWEEQISLYKRITTTAAKIASSTEDYSIDEKEARNFWIYYWGEASMIEDSNVYNAMLLFGENLNRYLQNRGEYKDSLSTYSYRLARACRNSLKNTWQPVKIDTLPESTPLVRFQFPHK
jgi:hypothetical protein